MEITEAPPRAELVGRASALVPLLKANVPFEETNRRLADETIEALTDAGALRLRVPSRFGGYDTDMRTEAEVIAQIARGSGSASWTAAVWAISSSVVSFFPDEVQDEVFATPDVRVCGILSPTAIATPIEGGVVVNGQWSWNTGSQQSHWNTNAAVLIPPDGEPQPIMILVPMSDLEIVDDWYTSGLRGSGSVTTVAKDVFVPQARVLPMGAVVEGRSVPPGGDLADYRTPLLPTAGAIVSATVLGMVKAAKEAFFERLPDRKITYTDYASQREAPITHLQVAEATVKIDEAEFHAMRIADLVDAKAAAGEAWTLHERVTVRLDMGAVCQRAKEAVDILTTASGASSIRTEVPIQRIERDIRTLNLHAIMHPDTNLELYGRVLCGLEPNTLYL